MNHPSYYDVGNDIWPYSRHSAKSAIRSSKILLLSFFFTILLLMSYILHILAAAQ